MKLSTKGRYGLRAMVDLAVYSTGDQVPLNAIAERQKLSITYLEQVFSTLRKSGMVKSVKGAQGGYILAEEPDRIKVGSILRALEGDLSIIDESSTKDANNPIKYCLSINVWDNLNKALNNLVDSISLGDLADEYKYINGLMAPMYYI